MAVGLPECTPWAGNTEGGRQRPCLVDLPFSWMEGGSLGPRKGKGFEKGSGWANSLGRRGLCRNGESPEEHPGFLVEPWDWCGKRGSQ